MMDISPSSSLIMLGATVGLIGLVVVWAVGGTDVGRGCTTYETGLETGTGHVGQ